MKRKPKDIICKCGHEKKFHDKVGAPIWDGWCNHGMGIKDETLEEEFGVDATIYVCMCNEYIPDNLLHIENLAKKRKLI